MIWKSYVYHLYMNLMPQEVEYTLLAMDPSMFKINETLYDWYVPAASKNIFPKGPQTGKQIDSQSLWSSL